MDFSSFSALVVEDNDFIRLMVKKHLSGFGFKKLYEAGNGKDGIALMEAHKPQIVICDINMEPGNGFDFLSHVRQMPQPLCDVPIIFLTSSADEAFVKKAVDMKIDAYLLKPIMPENLKKKVVAVMEKKVRA